MSESNEPIGEEKEAGRAIRSSALFALGGGLALAACLAGFLWFFSAVDDPYQMGWLFTVLGLCGAVIGAALHATVIAAIARKRSALPFSQAVAGTLACVAWPLLGWLGALLLDGIDSTPGSIFMIWAIASSVIGFAAPLPVALWLRQRALASNRTAPSAEIDAAARPSPRRGPLIAAAGLPGAITAVLFGLLGDPPDSGLFSLFFGVAAAVSLPVLTAVLLTSRKGRRRRRLILGLSMWFVGTVMLLAAMFGGWFIYELITGLTRFRL